VEKCRQGSGHSARRFRPREAFFGENYNYGKLLFRVIMPPCALAGPRRRLPRGNRGGGGGDDSRRPTRHPHTRARGRIII